MIKQLLLFSHFEMTKLFKLFTVKLYYYDGALEESADDFLDFFRRHKEDLDDGDRLNLNDVY